MGERENERERGREREGERVRERERQSLFLNCTTSIIYWHENDRTV